MNNKYKLIWFSVDGDVPLFFKILAFKFKEISFAKIDSEEI